MWFKRGFLSDRNTRCAEGRVLAQDVYPDMIWCRHWHGTPVTIDVEYKEQGVIIYYWRQY